MAMQTMPIASCNQRKFLPSTIGSAAVCLVIVMDPPGARFENGVFQDPYWYAICQTASDYFLGTRKNNGCCVPCLNDRFRKKKAPKFGAKFGRNCAADLEECEIKSEAFASAIFGWMRGRVYRRHSRLGMPDAGCRASMLECRIGRNDLARRIERAGVVDIRHLMIGEA